MSEIAEIVQTIEQLQQEFEDLTVRGLRTCGPEHLAPLKTLHEEFARIGAAHLATRISALVQAIENDERHAAVALLAAQSSLRVFERVLSLKFASRTLEASLSDNGAAAVDDDS